MDIVQGDFAFDFASGKIRGKAGPKEYLDPAIAAEGANVITLKDGMQIALNPRPVKAVMPDWSEYKSIAHYFNRQDFHHFPTWLYHPTEEAVIAQTAEEAWHVYGARLVASTPEEKARYGAGDVRWEFTKEWRTTPYVKIKPDPRGSGKELVQKAPDPRIAQHDLVRELVAAMQGGQNQFLVDLLTAMKAVPAAPAQPNHELQHAAASGDPPPPPVDAEKVEWIAKAEEVGVKIDRRWSADKIRNAVMTELEKRVAEAEAGGETAVEAV